MFDTPILLLIFNRPDLTRQAVAALAEVRPRRLFVAADGPRLGKEGEQALCREARQVIEAIDWPCQVFRLYSDVNRGCKIAVRSAIDWFFDSVEEGIILEDDCIPCASFFRFCSEMLSNFRHDTRIMAICGSYYGADNRIDTDSLLFSYFPDIWGWATWRRAWQHYDRDMSGWKEFYARGGLQALCGNRSEAVRYWARSFAATHVGKIDTWDYQWIYSVMAQGGLACYPTRNLVFNAGLRSDATHTTSPDGFPGLTGRVHQQIEFPLRLPRMVMRSSIDDIEIETKRLAIPPSDVIKSSFASTIGMTSYVDRILHALLDTSLADQVVLRDVFQRIEAASTMDDDVALYIKEKLATAMQRWRTPFDPALITLAYMSLLGRPAGENELNEWMPHMGVNLTFSNFLDAVDRSTEAQAHRLQLGLDSPAPAGPAL